MGRGLDRAQRHRRHREAVGRGDPTRLEFEPAGWIDTLWYYNKPTNHVLYSVLSRFSLAAWRAITGAAPSEWDEFAFRFPTFVAALLSVLGLGLLVHDLGFPRAAPAAAWLLAIHPWHVRFGGEGRGYALDGAVRDRLRLVPAPRRCATGAGAGGSASRRRSSRCSGSIPWHPLPPRPRRGRRPRHLAWARARATTALLRLARLRRGQRLAAMAYLQLMAPNLAQASCSRPRVGAAAAAPRPARRKTSGSTSPRASTCGSRASPDYTFPTLAGALAAARPGPARRLRRVAGARRVGLAAALAAPGARAHLLPRASSRRRRSLLLHRALAGVPVIERFAIFGLVAVVPLLVLGTRGRARGAPAAARCVASASPSGSRSSSSRSRSSSRPRPGCLLSGPRSRRARWRTSCAAAGEGIPGGVIRAGVGLGGRRARRLRPRRSSTSSAARRSPSSRAARRGGPAALRLLRLRRTEPAPVQATSPGARRSAAPSSRSPTSGAIESEFVYRVFRYTGRPLGGG